MIPGLWGVGDCFSTDDRDFSNAIHARSRMHSEIELDVTTDPPTKLIEYHHCDDTHEYDCEDGDLEGTGRSATTRMAFSNVRGSGNGLIHVDVTAAAANPLVTGAPDIDYTGTVTIDTANHEVTFNGMVTNSRPSRCTPPPTVGQGFLCSRCSPSPAPTPGADCGAARRGR